MRQEAKVDREFKNMEKRALQQKYVRVFICNNECGQGD